MDWCDRLEGWRWAGEIDGLLRQTGEMDCQTDWRGGLVSQIGDG